MIHKTLLTTTAMAIATTAAFGAASLRAPQIGGTATVATPTATNTARAGTMRTQTMKTSSVSTPSVTTTQSIATPVSTETTDARIALLKGIKGFNPGKIKDTTSAQQELNAINTRIEELQNKLDVAESAQVNIESKTYTKDEIDTLIAESEQKVPKIDERGNWTDPNGGLIVVPEGAVVIGPNDITIVDGKLSATSTHPVQNKTVTNTINEKQDKSTTLSFGNADGGWTSVDNETNYIKLYTDATGANGFDINPSMISTDLTIIANENQLITATAVNNELAKIYYYNLIDLITKYDGLVTRYVYETNAPYDKAQQFAERICQAFVGSLSEENCDFQYYSSNNTFVITRRQYGYYLKSSDLVLDGSSYYIRKTYEVNDGETSVTSLINNVFCANRTFCNVEEQWNNFTLYGATGCNGTNPKSKYTVIILEGPIPQDVPIPQHSW